MANPAPRGAGTVNNRIVGEVYLARAAQQRKQLGAQRQACKQHAGEGKKQYGKSQHLKHGYDYKDIVLIAQQILSGDFVRAAARSTGKFDVSFRRHCAFADYASTTP